MKKLFVAVIALALSTGSFAQANHKAHKGGKRGGVEHQDKMGEKLDLTDAQKTKMKSINENFRKNMQELNQNKSLDNAAKKQQRQTLTTEHRNQMQAILTPEQRKQWDEQKGNRGGKEWKGKMKKENKQGISRNGGSRGDKSGKIAKELQLSNDQASRLKTVNEGYKTDMKNVRSNEALTKDQKKDAMKRLQQEHNQKMEQILTREQVSRLQEIRKERRETKPGRITK